MEVWLLPRRCCDVALLGRASESAHDPVANLNQNDLRAALAITRANRRRWLMSDPLNYAEFDLPGSVTTDTFSSTDLVEVDFQTRPKQSGGIRQEVLLDPWTATWLQAVCDLICRQDLAFPHSLSAALFRLGLKCENPYEVWSSGVPAWIQAELAAGRTVVVADLRNYFPSVTYRQIGDALRGAGLSFEMVDRSLRLIAAINAVPDRTGKTRTGIPVSDDDFSWMLAELVMAPVDAAISGASCILGYRRWVDDLIVSVNPGNADWALSELASSVERHGFDLNESKTRIYASAAEFKSANLLSDHALVSELFLIASAGSMGSRQLHSFDDLVARSGQETSEQRRLWKRLYALGRRMKSPALLGRVVDDLQRMPGLELPILAYLAVFGWDRTDIATVSASLFESGMDIASLGLLRALLHGRDGEPSRAQVVLSRVDDSSPLALHPFCHVLAYACLLRSAAPPVVADHARLLLQRLPALESPMARRAGAELLWLHSDLRPEVATLIAGDRSKTVRSLGRFATNNADCNGLRIRAQPRAPGLAGWGVIGEQVAHGFGLA